MRENPHKIRNERGEISTDTAKIKKEKQTEYYEQLHVNKFDNLEEMDNLLEMYCPPKLNQKEIGKLNRPITKVKYNLY